MRQWRKKLCCRLRKQPAHPRPTWRSKPYRHGFSPLALTVAVGLLLAVALVRLLEARMTPVVATLARVQTENKIAALLEHTVVEDLARRGVSYSDFVTIQRDQAGTITALTTDMAAMNLLRAELVTEILAVLSQTDISEIQVPLGSLFDSELAWARGPAIQARAMSVGTVSAEFESRFSAAGVNQTLHRICLDLSVPITVILPGNRVEVPVHTQLCVAETVIVGQVPDTYLDLGIGPASG